MNSISCYGQEQVPQKSEVLPHADAAIRTDSPMDPSSSPAEAASGEDQLPGLEPGLARRGPDGGSSLQLPIIEQFAEEKANAPRLAKVTIKCRLVAKDREAFEAARQVGLDLPNRWMRGTDGFASWVWPSEGWGTLAPGAVLFFQLNRFLGMTVDEPTMTVFGNTEILATIHQLKESKCPLAEETLRETIEYCCSNGGLAIGLHHDRYEPANVLVTEVQFDPGTPKETRTLWHSDHISLDESHDTTIKTCYLSGRHFYPPTPFAFFYQGDPGKPVCPTIATGVGFRMCRIDFQALCSIFGSKERLDALHHAMWYWDRQDLYWYQGLDVDDPMNYWKYRIDDDFLWEKPEQSKDTTAVEQPETQPVKTDAKPDQTI